MNQGHFRTGMLILENTRHVECKENKSNVQVSSNVKERNWKMKKYLSVGQLLLKLIFPAFWTLLKTGEVDAAKQALPKLNFTEAFIDIELNSTFCLHCSGTKPLLWGFKDPMNRNKKYQNVSAASTITYSNEGLESLLCTLFTSYLQTGEYACYYDNLATSINIFVNDEDHLLLPLHRFPFLTLHEGTRSVIPCVPTISSTEVTLWKVKQQNPQRIQLDDSSLRYDPTVGFLVRYPSTSFKGHFYCLAHFENTTQKLAVNIDILPQTQSIPEVSIDASDARYVLLHSNFSLRCLVKIKLGTVLSSSRPRWSHPVTDASRIVVGHPVISKNSIHRMISETLTILNAQTTDEGVYQCNVTDHSNRENYSQVEIEVYESPQAPVVNFTKGTDILIESRGGTANLRAVYTLFPHTTDIQSVWTKDKVQLSLTTGKYAIKSSEEEFSLDMFNLTRADSGIYTVTAHCTGGAYNKSFHLFVKDTPTVAIPNSTFCCFTPGQNYQLHCESKGFPTPGLSWSWKHIANHETCDNATCDTTGEWKTIDDAVDANNSTQWIMNIDEERVWSILNVTARISGYYRCVSKNEMGIEKEDVQFIVSDVPEGLYIDVREIEPLERSSFQMTCKASADLYSDLQWLLMPNNSNETIPMDTDSVNKSTSSNSITLPMEIEDMRTNHSGTYICLALSRNMGQALNKSVSIYVREKQEPHFVNINWTTEIVAAVNTILVLDCTVQGTPRPTVTWFRDGLLLTSNLTGGKFEDNSQKLVISRVVEEDSGDYVCVAENGVGTIKRNISLSVELGGYQVSIKQGGSSAQAWILVTVGVGAAFMLILLLLVGRWFYKRKYKLMKLQGFNHQLFQEGQISFYDPNMPLGEQADLLPYDNRWEFPKDDLKFGRVLGQGAFGRVVKAEAYGLNDYEISTTVAVKMLKERADINQQKALAAELKILIHLGHHVNIVNLMGAVTTDIPKGELLVMVEYCRYGNLRNYLLRHRDTFVNDVDLFNKNPMHLAEDPVFDSSITGVTEIRSDSFMSSSGSGSTVFAVDNPNYRHRPQSIVNSDPKSPSIQSMGRSMSCSSASGSRYYCRVDSHEHVVTTSDLLCYSFQSSCGMDYLASKKLIHRDLAARNVLLADDKVVKICDFGLAKDCYYSENYVKKGDGPLPIKWMAIESIRDHVFTTKSDVWSFGVLMYEFFTLGSNPYPGIEIDEEFYKRLSAGYRMEKPEYCPEDAYHIMQMCWKANPDDRPNFNQISDVLGGFLETGLKQHFIDLNEPYLEMNCKMQSPDYSNMPTGDSPLDPRVYMNSESSIATWYDSVPTVHRSIFDSSNLLEVPAIQLETIQENNELEEPRLHVETFKYSNEYLKMGQTETNLT